MPLMSLPYDTDVSFKDGQIVLTIELDRYLANESVEISGYAAQVNGAFATFYDIQVAKENPAGKVVMFVKATPSIQFQTGEPVIVALRASRVWVTVLAEPDEPMSPPGKSPAETPAGPAAPEGHTWPVVTAVSWAAPLPAPSSSASETSAGSDSSFQYRG
jgi:hypothetical protein